MKAERQREKEEMDAHQKNICEKMAKMDEYLEQYNKRKTKRFEKNTEQVSLILAMHINTMLRFGYAALIWMDHGGNSAILQ